MKNVLEFNPHTKLTTYNSYTSVSVSPIGTGLLANTPCLHLCGQILLSFGLTSAEHVVAIIACYNV